MKTDNILEVRNLETRFKVGRRTVYAVNDVSFSLKRGKTLGIVGESGCGKSVSAHSITQLLPKNGGITKGAITYSPEPGHEIELSGFKRTSREIRSIRGKDISMIFQDPLSSLDPVYTVGWQIEESLRQHERVSKKDAQERIINLLHELGIPDPAQRIKDYPHQFSGGMKQRVMIATGMICNPNILIADEPTTALDVTIQAQILELMKEYQRNHGTSIILITHNMGIVAESCDFVAVMYMGRIVEYGALLQVFNEPMHPYTRALLKSVPVLGMGKGEPLQSIRGNTPDASERSDICEFQPRCDSSCERCKQKHPPNHIGEDGHEVRCWLFSGEGVE